MGREIMVDRIGKGMDKDKGKGKGKGRFGEHGGSK
jgi:hypothetical protein